MHNDWEEMLPFYIAGALPKPETTRLENHLARCEVCSKSLEEWRAIAGAVRADAASQLRNLPPLSAEVLQQAQRGGGSSRTETLAFAPVRPARRYPTTAFSAVAAFAVIIIGGVLALMLMRGLPQQGAEGVVLLPSPTPTSTTMNETPLLVTPQIIVIEPSETPIIPTEIVPTAEILNQTQPTSLPPPTLFVPPVQPTRFVPQATPFVPDETGIDGSSLALETGPGMGGGGGCTVEAMIPSGSVINLYSRPRTDATVVGTIGAGSVMTAVTTSDNGWFQVQTAGGSVGWVQQGLVAASGSCDGLPMIVAEAATEVPMTPTATVIPFEPLEPIPSEAAVTQNEAEAQSAATAEVG